MRHQAIILGEDLGTVPDGLRETLAEKAVLGMRVLPFEQTQPGRFKPILDWPDNALATTGTHDLAPLAGWLENRDIDWFHRLHLIDAATELQWRHDRQKEHNGLRRTLETNYGPLPDNDAVIDAAIRYVGHTRAPLVLVPLEDLLGCDEQPNLPGTTQGHPNWRRRFALPVRELLDDEDAARRLELLAQAREQEQAQLVATLAHWLPPGATVLDLGSGDGRVVLQLARQRADLQLCGVENALLPWLWSRWRYLRAGRPANVSLHYGNFWDLDWSRFDVIHAFLSPAPMARVWAHFQQHAANHAQLVSNSFGIAAVPPQQRLPLNGPLQKELLIWGHNHGHR